MGLSQTIQDPASIAEDCAKLMDEQVATKKGISGMAMKATYGVVKGIGADYIPKALTKLLPETLTALDPIWAEGLEKGDPVAHLSENRDRAADTILSITDARIEKSSNGVITGVYGKMRKSVKDDIAAAVPGLAKILGEHSQA
ncbi:MAG: hypothetical protein HC824_17150 [Synechococcales cyanobacterium RM1_1_8]|nr:hypothetical protein [Synechococcales cyanobacterium RM1_1_8]